MPPPAGWLSDAQLEVMEILWSGPKEGLSTSQVWEEVQEARQVARTTVLTVLHRLEQRKWIRRSTKGKVARFRAACTRDEAEANLAAQFLDEHFQGSATRLISSLLGSGHAKPSELARLRKLLDDRS